MLRLLRNPTRGFCGLCLDLEEDLDVSIHFVGSGANAAGVRDMARGSGEGGGEGVRGGVRLIGWVGCYRPIDLYIIACVGAMRH